MHLDTVLEAFANINGATFVGIDTDCGVSLKGGRKNPHYQRIHKVTLGSTVLCFQNKHVNGYEAMVRRRLAQAGKDPDSFKLGPRAWGTRLPEMPIVVHEKDGVVKHYLEVIYMHAGTSHYYMDTPDNIISKDMVIGLETPPARQSGKGQAGNNDRVIIRTYDIASITALRINNTVYR